jgi:hypothetical protein
LSYDCLFGSMLSFFLMSPTGDNVRRSADTLRQSYCRASKHPTKGTRRSYVRSYRLAPAAVHGSAPELASAGAAGHLAEAVRRLPIEANSAAADVQLVTNNQLNLNEPSLR